MIHPLPNEGQRLEEWLDESSRRHRGYRRPKTMRDRQPLRRPGRDLAAAVVISVAAMALIWGAVLAGGK